MVIVAGHITVEPQQRQSYLAGCVSIVARARGAAGCLDVAITAALIDPGRVNIFERWESQATLETFGGGGRLRPRQRLSPQPQHRPQRPLTKEPRDATQHRPSIDWRTLMTAVRLIPLPDGPYAVTGPLELVDPDGEAIKPAAEQVYLCRCGRSANKPFCDGSHARTGWTVEA